MELLRNKYIEISVKELGAELTSIVNLSTGEELLWQGDPIYWNRQSPILFPIVGCVCNNSYTYDGVCYKMGRHGFARDMEFSLVEKSDTHILFELVSNETTKKFYPVDFILQIGYEIHDNTVKVIWNVLNTGEKIMHFQIGAHPAFNVKGYNADAPVQGYFSLLPLERSYTLSVLEDNGCVGNNVRKIECDELGIIPITKDTFNQDALILEDSQTSIVTLLDLKRHPYIRITFDAPVVGLWSPAKCSYAPFVCVEPWYGRSDKTGFRGEFSERDWVLHLDPEEYFRTSYDITIL